MSRVDIKVNPVLSFRRKQMLNEMKVMRICSQCKEHNVLQKDSVSSEMFQLMGNGNSIRIMYYECPKCHKMNILQIDNDETLKTLEEVKTLFVKAMKLKESSKHRGQLKTRFERRRELLRKQRVALAIACDGMVATNDRIILTIESGDLYDV